MVRVGVVKTGNIGSSLVLEFLFDERADREDIDVEVVTSGAKMGVSEGEKVAKKILDFKPDLILYSTPNPSAPGPMKVIDLLTGKNAIVFGDSPGIKIKEKLEEKGLGYFFVKADSMIGARREFLDPTEMAIFNSDMLKVLAVTGVLRLVQEEVDGVIDEIKNDMSPKLPRIVVDKDVALAYSGIE
ncbi:MAG: F420-dependent methylenetetrahydromethanopterin dehydrogenase, partial [Candidatus Hydrothermarchaeales archaeon]